MSDVTVDIRNALATVTLCRPDKHNAFDEQVIQDLTAAFDNVANDTSVRVMVLASQGKTFSAGADLQWMKKMATYSYEQNLQDAQALARMFHRLYTLPCATVARVQGAAFGGAVGLTACCDMAVAGERASFALSEVKIGLIPSTISPYLVQAMGPRATQRYSMTGERFDAQTALHLGLVSQVVAEEQLDAAVTALINKILANSPNAVRAAKQLVADINGQKIDEQLLQMTSESIAAIRVSAEGQEGLAAFLEKRRPAWLQTADSAEDKEI